MLDPSDLSGRAAEWAALGILSATLALPLAAQGVTDAAIEGRVARVDSTPVAQAVVRVTNTSTGERWQATTGTRGRFFIEYLSVGGPYRIEVTAIGYVPARRDSVRLALGQRLTAHFTLAPAVLQLEEITVTGTEDPRFDAARTGPGQVISDSMIAKLPISRRDYTELARLSPQVTKSPNGGLSFVGQHDRYNSIQVDGTNNNDPFGKYQSGNGTPGWDVGLTAFTPEAVKELQILSAPFDVRYGSFAGGLINAVTQSGSNRVEGSILGYLASSDLVGTDVTGSRGNDFSRRELGLTFGAPVVRDRVAVFVNAGVQQRSHPPGRACRRASTPRGARTPPASVCSMRPCSASRTCCAVMAPIPGPSRPGRPTHRPGIFSRRSRRSSGWAAAWRCPTTTATATSRDETLGRDRGFYPLSSSGSENPETINATRLAWTATFASSLLQQAHRGAGGRSADLCSQLALFRRYP